MTEGITEIIAVTKDNAAPIGIIQRPGKLPSLILFKGSKTEENIRRHGWVTANFVSDSYLYADYAFNDVKHEDLAEDGTYQYLKSADAYVRYTTRIVHETDQTYMIELEQDGDEIVLRPGIRRVNRGFDAVIDATVHATRYIRTHDQELADRLAYDFDLIRKCGGPREQQAADLLRSICGL
ncbi:MAG TPA: DUF447 family protein [Methanocorpusculum sp.]|nr:DUF447 family protein [Methanocorpusculum sp.]